MQRFHKWLYETVQNIHVLTDQEFENIIEINISLMTSTEYDKLPKKIKSILDTFDFDKCSYKAIVRRISPTNLIK